MIHSLNATSQSIDVQIVDDAGLPVLGLVAATFPAVMYSLAGANADVSVTLSDLATITTAWSAGGVKERANGVYRLDLPDAAFAAAGEVKVFGETSGKHLLSPWIDVGVLPANITALLITSSGHIANVDTLATYTGNTVQTGDAYAAVTALGARLNAGSVQYVGPAVGVGGAVKLYQGSANLIALGNPIGPIPIPLAVQDLTGYLPSAIQMRWQGVTLTASAITSPGTSNQSVTFEANSIATAAMQPDVTTYFIWALSGTTSNRLDVTGTIQIVATI
jgi:hypothetical protein